jgi:hypothetical protein
MYGDRNHETSSSIFDEMPSNLKLMPMSHAESPERISKKRNRESVGFSNRVNKDLIVEYKPVEAPPTERFFDTFPDSREETKQSLRRDNFNEYVRQTTR